MMTVPVGYETPTLAAGNHSAQVAQIGNPLSTGVDGGQ